MYTPSRAGGRVFDTRASKTAHTCVYKKVGMCACSVCGVRMYGGRTPWMLNQIKLSRKCHLHPAPLSRAKPRRLMSNMAMCIRWRKYRRSFSPLLKPRQCRVRDRWVSTAAGVWLQWRVYAKMGWVVLIFFSRCIDLQSLYYREFKSAHFVVIFRKKIYRVTSHFDFYNTISLVGIDYHKMKFLRRWEFNENYSHRINAAKNSENVWKNFCRRESILSVTDLTMEKPSSDQPPAPAFIDKK